MGDHKGGQKKERGKVATLVLARKLFSLIALLYFP